MARERELSPEQMIDVFGKELEVRKRSLDTQHEQAMMAMKLSAEQNEKQFELARDEATEKAKNNKVLRFLQIGVFFLIVAILSFACYLIKHDNSIGTNILIGTLMFLGGFATGWGYAKS